MNQEKKNLLVFGYGLALILGFFSIHHGLKHKFGSIHFIILCLAVVLIVISLMRVELLRGFYQRWMKVAHAIGTIFSTIVLSVLFYGVFGMVGIILRLLHKDLLDEKLAPSKDSYWIKRELKTFDKKSYTQQF